MDNGISERQNQDINIAHLAAMRQLYSDSKLLFNIKFIICVVIIIAANLLGFISTQQTIIHSIVVVIKIFSVIVPFIAFDRWINNKRELAARIQEEFDHNVLMTSWIANKHGAKGSVLHEINKYRRKYAKKKGIEWAKGLRDWYNINYSQMPLSIGRLHCQFTNINWDSDLRTFFKRILLTVTFGSVAVLVAISMWLNNSFISSFENVFLPFAPMIIFLCQTIVANNKTIEKLSGLQCQVANIAAEKNKPDVSEDELFKLSNELQNGIFEYRKDAFPIPDMIYNFLREGQEESIKEVSSFEKNQYNSTDGKM